MSDSLEIYFSVENATSSGLEANPFPYEISRRINQDGEVKSSRGVMTDAVSPLTAARFKVQSVFREKEAKQGGLVGYLVSINNPTCTTGNNALNENLVYLSAQCDLEQHKYYLLSHGACVDAVKQISIEHAEIKAVTLTYLFRYDTKEEAIAANQELNDHAVAVLNTNVTNPKAKKPVYSVGSTGNNTVYINVPGRFKIKSYVKSGPTPDSKEKFDTPKIEQDVYQESAQHLRVEIELYCAWLKAKKLDSPQNWFGSEASDNANQLGLQQIRDVLRLNENLRYRAPKQVDLDSKVTRTERDIVAWHLQGRAYKAHPNLVGKSVQYVSQIKRKVEKELRIDMSIPWKIQKTKVSKNLGNELVWKGQYKPPLNLQPYCFTRATVRGQLEVLRDLKKKLAITQGARQNGSLQTSKGKGISVGGATTTGSVVAPAKAQVTSAPAKTKVKTAKPSK